MPPSLMSLFGGMISRQLSRFLTSSLGLVAVYTPIVLALTSIPMVLQVYTVMLRILVLARFSSVLLPSIYFPPSLMTVL